MITVGQSLPAGEFTFITAEGKQVKDTQALFADKRVVLFAVPGAFTPTCSARHLPGFKEQAEALRAKGVDAIACMAVNDAFVMAAWARDQGLGEEITMLADGSAAFTRALGLEMDLGARGMGVRCQRFALIARDGKVAHVGIEAPGAFEASKAETILAVL